MTKIVSVSDTHGLHHNLKLPPGDILIHAGDFSSMGKLQEVMNFMNWFENQPYKHKIFIGGNHDFLLQEDPQLFQGLLEGFSTIVYLQEETIEIDGLKIYGTPWVKNYYSWAFMEEEDRLEMKYARIPKDTDVLIVHGPPYGILDKNNKGEHCGSMALLNCFQKKEIEPKICIFGHIHHSAGIKHQFNTTFINTAVLDDEYKLSFKPKVIEI